VNVDPSADIIAGYQATTSPSRFFTGSSPLGSFFIAEVDHCKENHRRNSIYGQDAQEDSSFQPIWETPPKKNMYVYVWICCASGYLAINIMVKYQKWKVETADWLLLGLGG
jgi:hypothetical protein